jgi:hypothetical protein
MLKRDKLPSHKWEDFLITALVIVLMVGIFVS